MQEFTLEIDYYYDYDELFEYLFCLRGINDVIITKDKLLSIYVKYDNKIINEERVKLEILAFLELLNTPSIYGFDRHFKGEVAKYTIKRESICCEFCFANIIEELYDIPGIVKVESNFYTKFFHERSKSEKYYIDIYYNPKLISLKEMKEIEKDLDIYD